jgi:hypothetical protein
MLICLQLVFPEGGDGDCDTFTLAERRDDLEAFIQEVVSGIDFLLYNQLYTFLGASTGMEPLIRKVTRCQAMYRGRQLRRQYIRVSGQISLHILILPF